VCRLVIVLLETCGQYFGKGAVAKRLDRFLAYLQRYVLSKPPPPLDVSIDLEVLQHVTSRVTLP
jgi:regulator of nonsense transcripts 2